MKITKQILAIGLFISLSGCAAMSVSECQTANWSAIGEKDGSSGKERRLAQYFKACSKADIMPSQSLYEQGYIRGQNYYCQPNTIFYQALKGNANYQVCPVQRRSQLRPYYEVANDYYRAERHYQQYQDHLMEYTRRASDMSLKPEERDRYLKKLNDLQRDSYRIESEYRDAIRKLEQFKYQHRLN
ncbi:DUF2799 domain-containing protein [Acinetobacter sp. MD2(2019)]|uniref:DUF2799 domain-containing protein n=1 Tax=Acinetobacter sp. MD2(2019) TaxID=2605273 RepID=UPI002D1E6F44|nr:DUF2799 domain-containing protein [Acinetobacter sp. MD2(2019)]MEB3754765.1 DUF2799 domain-containing protein [Acinetobacter sp. MD2(2019)]